MAGRAPHAPVDGPLQKVPCAIADGHHRYETSLNYAAWAKKKGRALFPGRAG
ncbi:MAG: hypothetical protein IPH91_10720 [Elusimicrobia bacterium]|nr:hypothetical protein [Elusimicrobiota bacterium]